MEHQEHGGARRPPDLRRFGHDDAWRLGVRVSERCREAGHAVTILVMLGEQRVFHVGLAGTSADRDSWVDRKARVVRRFGMSSRDVFVQHVEGKPQFFETFGLAREKFAPYGGAVPITVGGCLVGVVAVSGLTSDEDHELAVDALHDLASAQAAGDDAGIHGA